MEGVFWEGGFRCLMGFRGSGINGAMFPRVHFGRSLVWFGWVLVLVGLCPQGWLRAGSFEPLAGFRPEATEVARLGRVRSLMASAGPTNRPVVRVVFYGQSITIYPWWLEVSQRLRETYPHVQFEIHNLAISGFQAVRLAFTCEHDVIPLQPDLIILHAYGFEPDFHRLLTRLRQRTTADVLVQRDHPLTAAELVEVTDPAKLATADPSTWEYKNYVWLPRVVAATGCALADVRGYWKEYCRARGRKASDLLADPTHPNEEGNRVLAASVLAYLVPGDSAGAVDPWNTDKVREVRILREAARPLQRLTLEFTGSRVDAIADGDGALPVEVWVDGRKPSAIPEIRFFGRTTAVPGRPWPALTTVESVASRVPELWTLRVLRMTPGNQFAEFELHGSETGFDGVGSSRSNFVSNSGRVTITPGSWNLGLALNSQGIGLPVDYRIEWRCAWTGMDAFVPRAPREPGLEQPVTLVAGLTDGVHRLELEGESLDALGALRVFRPAGAVQAVVVERVTRRTEARVGWKFRGSEWQFRKEGEWPAGAGMETSTNLLEWKAWTPDEAAAAAGWSVAEEPVRYFRVR
jgi:hypothetical protein